MLLPDTILVVDDEAPTRMNLRAFLEDQGYRVLEASGGLEALACAREQAPDLIMLDITMPGLDGFETCRRLKASPETAAIPVLFLSALMETADKVQAFACGGVDYVTKPCQFQEVESRVRTHLEIRRRGRQLEEQNAALRRLEQLRDSFTHMVAHDMRTPLTGIIAGLELALEDLPPGDGGLRRKLEMAASRAGALAELITQMLQLSRMEAQELPLDRCLCDVSLLAESAMASVRTEGERRCLTVETPGPLLAWCDPGIVSRVLENLLGNALKFIPKDGKVRLTVADAGTRVRVSVADNGPGMEPAFQEHVFQKFNQAPSGARGQGVGLGLAFCKLAVEAHRGEIGVDSSPGQGCTFWFTLPALP